MKPHFCHVFPAFGDGGPEVRTALIINATADRFRHTVLSISGEVCGAHRIEAGGDVSVDGVSRPTGWGGFPRVLASTLSRLQPDLLMTYGWGGVDAIVAGRLAGMRKIIHEEDGFLPDEARRQKPHRLVARQLLLRFASRVVFPSQTLAGIARRAWRLPQRKLRYVPNGVDSARFSPGMPEQRFAVRRKLGFADGDIVIGTVGHFRPEKNHARLIRAFSTLRANGRTTKLLLVGDGELRSTLERQIDDLRVRDRVVITGVVRDPADCYRAMDLFVLSSDSEQMPIVLLEAMAAGLPIVSTDVGDVRDMIADENRAYVTALGDDEQFESALTILVHGLDERRILGPKNRSQCAERYDLQTMVTRYRDLYCEVIEDAL